MNYEKAYKTLAQLIVLCDSSNPKKVTLDKTLYKKAMNIIDECDKSISFRSHRGREFIYPSKPEKFK